MYETVSNEKHSKRNKLYIKSYLRDVFEKKRYNGTYSFKNFFIVTSSNIIYYLYKYYFRQICHYCPSIYYVLAQDFVSHNHKSLFLVVETFELQSRKTCHRNFRYGVMQFSHSNTPICSNYFLRASQKGIRGHKMTYLPCVLHGYPFYLQEKNKIISKDFDYL